MDNLNLEMMAEERRKQLLHTVDQLRLEEEAEKNAHRPGWFARSMISVSSWMIASGELLQRRYNETQSVQKNFSMGQR